MRQTSLGNALILAGAACFANQASAQSFNIDIDDFDGAGAGGPVAAYSGAGTAGNWNLYSFGTNTPLVDTDGNATGVVLSFAGSGYLSAENDPNTIGNDELLLDDTALLTSVDPGIALTFSGLLPGRYEVITYAIYPNRWQEFLTTVEVWGADGGPMLVYSQRAFAGFVVGETHARHFVTVTDDSMLTIVAIPTGVHDGCINGLQVRYLPCIADVDDGSGAGTPDGGVTIDDLLFFLGLFDAGDARADVDDGSFTGTRDGGVTVDDLLYFLYRFDAGC